MSYESLRFYGGNHLSDVLPQRERRCAPYQRPPRVHLFFAGYVT